MEKRKDFIGTEEVIIPRLICIGENIRIYEEICYFAPSPRVFNLKSVHFKETVCLHDSDDYYNWKFEKIRFFLFFEIPFAIR